MEFSRQENWSGLPFFSLGNLLDQGIEPTSLASPALAGAFFTAAPPGKATYLHAGVSNSAPRFSFKVNENMSTQRLGHRCLYQIYS